MILPTFLFNNLTIFYFNVFSIVFLANEIQIFGNDFYTRENLKEHGSSNSQLVSIETRGPWPEGQRI